MGEELNAIRRCLVKNCPGKTTKRIRLYKVPQNDIKAWCANLRIPTTKVTFNSRVCSRHFEKECMYTNVLKKGARPTLNLGHEGAVVPNGDLQDCRNRRLCCAVGCQKTSPPNILYSFPTNRWQLKEWLINCVIKADMVKHKCKYLCADHFDPSQVHGRILKKDAVPLKDTEHDRSEVQEKALKILCKVGKPIVQHSQANILSNCVVRNCPGKDSETIGMYKIPEDDIDAYCALLNLKSSSINDNTRICSRHFEQKYLRLTKLGKGARPTLNLGNKGFVLPSLQPRRPWQGKLHCCIVGCDATSPPEKLFMFPSAEERLQKWLSICNIKEGRRKKFLRICGRHFDPAMITGQRLKKDALPIMVAEDKDEEIQNNSFQTCFEDTINAEENLSDNDSDEFDGLECKSSCRTCVEVLKDCERYREHFFALEVALQEEQENFEALKYQNEQLMAELEARQMI